MASLFGAASRRRSPVIGLTRSGVSSRVAALLWVGVLLLGSKAFAASLYGGNGFGVSAIDVTTGATSLVTSQPYSILTSAPPVIPIPAAGWLFGGALGGLACLRRRRTA